MSLRSLDSRCLHNNTQSGHVQARKSRTARHACQSLKVTVSSRSLKHRLCAEKAADAVKWIYKSEEGFKTLSARLDEAEAVLLGRVLNEQMLMCRRRPSSALSTLQRLVKIHISESESKK